MGKGTLHSAQPDIFKFQNYSAYSHVSLPTILIIMPHRCAHAILLYGSGRLPSTLPGQDHSDAATRDATPRGPREWLQWFHERTARGSNLLKDSGLTCKGLRAMSVHMRRVATE